MFPLLNEFRANHAIPLLGGMDQLGQTISFNDSINLAGAEWRSFKVSLFSLVSHTPCAHKPQFANQIKSQIQMVSMRGLVPGQMRNGQRSSTVSFWSHWNLSGFIFSMIFSVVYRDNLNKISYWYFKHHRTLRYLWDIMRQCRVGKRSGPVHFGPDLD